MKNRQLALIFFLSFQLFIFAMLISLNDIISTKTLSLISESLCFIMVLLTFCKTKDYFIMLFAFFFTLIADIFMIFFDTLPVIGLTLLNIVQLLYFVRTFIESDYKKANVLIRLLVLPICIYIGHFLLKERFDTKSFLWTIYIVNNFINILFTIKDIGINNLFPIGLIFLFIHASLMMFLALDSYTIVNISFVNFLHELPFDIRQIFYLPAQTILACSVFTVNKMSFSKYKEEDN